VMRDRGYLCEVVEHWNPHARVRKDLFGFIDILCLSNDEILGLQTTTKSNMPARIKKICDHENFAAVLRSGIKLVVHGWKKDKTGKWVVDEFVF
jgi:hypothetical protein